MTSGQDVVRSSVPKPPRRMKQEEIEAKRKQKEEAAVSLYINKENNKMRNSGKFGNIFIALLMVASLTIAGCGGGGGGTAEEPPPPMPTQEELCADAGNSWVGGECLTPAQVTFNTALAAINAAPTAEDAQAAYDGVTVKCCVWPS